jgi:hypothetical protein
MQKIEFTYQGETVEYEWWQNDLHAPFQDLTRTILCLHPAFITALGIGPQVVCTSLMELFNIGKKSNPEFFEAMRNAFMANQS